MTQKEETAKELSQLSQVKREIERMLNEARDQAEQILKAAADDKRARKEAARQRQEKTMQENAYLEEYVPVELFKDNGAYKNDVFVSVNGENCLIQRGKPVLVKRKFAQVLDASRRQDILAAEWTEKLAGEYERIRNEF